VAPARKADNPGGPHEAGEAIDGFAIADEVIR
jgi:hypothetical protein